MILFAIRRSILPMFVLALVLTSAPACSIPMYTYLTWQGDTSTTITVNFQTAEPGGTSTVYYDTAPREGDIDAYAYQAAGTSHTIPNLPAERTVHVVELTGLQPNTTYYFVAGEDEGGFSPEYSFSTIPDGPEPIRFVTGGDMNVGYGARDLMKLAGQQDPMFVVVGGDIAYANGDLKNYKKWDRWFRYWTDGMVTTDGRMIPLVLAIGNHETDGSYGQSPEQAPFLFGYFAQSSRSYFSRTFGENFAFLVLDSGHAAAHDGDQRVWLEATLQWFRDTPYTFAVYHVPLYPSHRPYDGAYSVLGRRHWEPLFSEYGLTAAFENHDHTHKRTHLIKDGQIDPDGVLYLGDGCFGVDVRPVDEVRRWFEAEASSTQHFWIVDVTEDGATYRAMNRDGEIFDETKTEYAGAEASR